MPKFYVQAGTLSYKIFDLHENFVEFFNWNDFPTMWCAHFLPSKAAYHPRKLIFHPIQHTKNDEKFSSRFSGDVGCEVDTQRIVQGSTQVLSKGKETRRQWIAEFTSGSGDYCARRLPQSPRNTQVMDEALVYPEAGIVVALQDAQGQKLALGRHGAVDFVPSDWATKQERWILL